MNTLNEIHLNICDITVKGFDCGKRWNGFIVPLFRVNQISNIAGLLIYENYTPEFSKTEYKASGTGEWLYIIEEGYTFTSAATFDGDNVTYEVADIIISGKVKEVNDRLTFEPDYFSNDMSEAYFSDNWEQITNEIINQYK